MAVAFPTSGPEPFVLSSLLGTLAVTLFVFLALPREERLLRRATALYGAAVLVVYAVPNAMGGNVVRLSNLAAAPVLALGLAGPAAALLLVLCALPLLYWQWQGAVRDVSRAIADPSAAAQLLHAADRGAARADRRGAGADRDPADPGPLGGLLHGARSSSSPAAGSASSNPTNSHLFRSDLTPGRLPRLAAGERGQLRRPAQRDLLRLPRPPRGGAGRRRASLPEADLEQRATGACSRCATPPA